MKNAAPGAALGDVLDGGWAMPGAAAACAVAVVALVLYYVASLAVTVAVTAVLFLALVAALVMLVLASRTDLREHINVFIALHATFMVFATLLTADSQCDEKQIHNYDEHYEMQFISTKMLQAKYSRRLECNLLPPLVNMNTAVLIVQVHVTLSVLARDAPERYMQDHMYDLLCYLGVLGFSAVMVFDSQNVTGLENRTHVHLMGVALVVVAVCVMHGLALIGGYIIALSLLSYVYVGFVVLYSVAMLVFMILFVLEEPFAVQSEYAVLLLFFTLSACNLLTLARVVELQRAATAPAVELQPAARSHGGRNILDFVGSVGMLAFVMGLVSMIFLLEYVSM
jgi:hypothetical protein